jgi:hypothetical protein
VSTRHKRERVDIAGRPAEAVIELRYLTRKAHHQRLSIKRTLRGTFTTLTPPPVVLEIQLRYTDPYDIQRDSPWQTLALHETRRTHPR